MRLVYYSIIKVQNEGSLLSREKRVVLEFNGGGRGK